MLGWPPCHHSSLTVMQSWISLRRFGFTGISARYGPGKRFVLWCGLLILALAASELVCRALGLHTPVIYETTDYGYRIKPNQDINRFGNRVYINSQGLRSEPMSPLPADGVVRVLCIGDSITNGGTRIDQADTYPYRLQQLMRNGGNRVEVLNASAPGWAITNEVRWLQRNGTYHSRVVMMVIGTTDLFQEFAGAEIVSVHPSFPGSAPVLALEELVLRYLLPKLQRRSLADPGAQPSAPSLAVAKENIVQLQNAADFAARAGAKSVVLYVEQPGQLELADTYTSEAKALLFESLRQHGIPFSNTRDSVERAGGLTLFRDGLHPNTEGNRVLAKVAANLLAPVVDGITPLGK